MEVPVSKAIATAKILQESNQMAWLSSEIELKHSSQGAKAIDTSRYGFFFVASVVMLQAHRK
jgi:hypothetical protein